MKQKRILLAFIHYPSSSGRFLRRAFERLGHDVKTVGPCTGPFIWGTRLADTTIDLPTVEVKDVPNAVAIPAQPVLDSLGDWQPDLIVTADSAFTLSGDTPCPHVVYGVDNHARDYQIVGHDGQWDHHFFAHQFAGRMQDKNTSWLPCGYDPEIHVNTTPFYERPVHAMLLGVGYPERMQLAERLGKPFGEPERVFMVGVGLGPILQEYATQYNTSLVSLCKSAAGDVAQRVFEGMAMGCVILTDPCHDFEALGLEKGKHYLEYTTPDEAFEQLKALVDAPTERVEEIIEAAGEWVKPHTWDARCQQILDTVFDE